MRKSEQRILGHEKIQEILRREFQKNRIPSAYLFTGKKEIGKKTVALELAAVINCKQSDGYACRKCSSCRKIFDPFSDHSDVVLIQDIRQPVVKRRRSLFDNVEFYKSLEYQAEDEEIEQTYLNICKKLYESKLLTESYPTLSGLERLDFFWRNPDICMKLGDIDSKSVTEILNGISPETPAESYLIKSLYQSLGPEYYSGSIRIDQIRKVVQRTVVHPPFEGRKKVYIIDDAENMTTEAENCLLKTLEEPPEYALIILVSSKPSDLLPTTRSRCRTIRFTAPTIKTIQEKIQNDLQYDEQRARLIAGLTQGSFAAAYYMDWDQRLENRRLILDQFKKMNFDDAQAVFELTELLAPAASGNKKTARIAALQRLEFVRLWLHDRLLIETGVPSDYAFAGVEIEQYAPEESLNQERIFGLLEIIDHARKMIYSNVDVRLAVESALFSMASYLQKRRIQ